MNSPHLLLIAFFFAPIALGYDTEEQNPEFLAEQLLREQGIKSAAYYHEKAIEKLQKEGKIYDLSRVEVTGMYTAGDEKKLPTTGMFSHAIAPSAWAKKDIKKPLLKQLYQKLTGVGSDAMDALFDANGVLSENGKTALEPLRGKEVNELYAHSWGSELVYNAILAGYINPPKKIVILGCPDANLTRWEVLAEKTGTEVHFLISSNDKVTSEAGPLQAWKIKDPSQIRGAWDVECAHRDCNRYERKGQFKSHRITTPGFSGHDRRLYYNELIEHPIDEIDFHSLDDLQEKEANLITRAEEKMYSASWTYALFKARSIIVRADARRDAAFKERERKVENEDRIKLAESLRALHQLAQAGCANAYFGESDNKMLWAAYRKMIASRPDYNWDLKNAYKDLSGCPRAFLKNYMLNSALLHPRSSLVEEMPILEELNKEIRAIAQQYSQSTPSYYNQPIKSNDSDSNSSNSRSNGHYTGGTARRQLDRAAGH